ncbi:MAG TPA: hypothetical protein VFK29_03185 [Rhodanobacteraceae bacterium]|jgi:hypothetical protein|nr:hypothetical protein [Rhodanobacteraceae bacterium]
MVASNIDDQGDFVMRQYANLVASGLDVEAARVRLREVLGKAAVEHLDARDGGANEARAGERAAAARLMEAAKALGGNAADTHAAFLHSLDEARLFALDWWRPIRTFLLYVLFLLGLGVLVAIIYALAVLPAFSHLDRTLAMEGGAASWIMAMGAIRLFAPLIVMAILFVLLATLWYGMRLRLARLAPLAGPFRFRPPYGRSGKAYQALLCLEYASVLKAGGVADAAVLDPALRLAQWPPGKPFQVRGSHLDEGLKQAERLGTFGAELEWQRRLHWSRAQSDLELSRDRSILFSRVLFYVLIGIMVTVLYLPIFSIASTFGVH